MAAPLEWRAMNQRLHLDLTAVLVATFCCCCWGINQTAIKVANTGFSPLFAAGLRGLIAASLVFLWSVSRGERLFARDGSLPAGIAIGTIFAVEFALLYWGITYTTASRSIIFMYMAPFVVAIGAHLWIPGERLRLVQVVGLVAAFAGMAMAFGDAFRLPSRTQLLGDVLVVGAAILWGTTTLLAKMTNLARVPPSKTLLYQLAASIVLLPLSFALGEPGLTEPRPIAIAALLYQGVVVAFVSYLSWYWLISRYPAGRLSAFSFLAPIVGVLAGHFLLGEAVTPALILALALVAAGIYLVNRRQRSAPVLPHGKPA